MLPQFLLNGFADGCFIGIVALSASVFYGAYRFLNVSQAGLFVLAGYSLYEAARSGFGVAGGVILSIALAATFAAGIDVLLFRSLQRRAASVAVLLATSLGVYELSVSSAALAYGYDQRVVSAVVPPAMTVGSLLLTRSQVTAMVVFSTLGLLWIWLVQGTRVGLWIRALKADPELLASYGSDVAKLRTSVSAAAAAFTAVAACVSVYDVGVNPDRGMGVMLDGLAGALLGGMGSAGGPLVGGVSLGLIKGMVMWQLPARWEPAVTVVVLTVLLLVRPGGLRSVTLRGA